MLNPLEIMNDYGVKIRHHYPQIENILNQRINPSDNIKRIISNYGFRWNINDNFFQKGFVGNHGTIPYGNDYQKLIATPNETFFWFAGNFVKELNGIQELKKWISLVSSNFLNNMESATGKDTMLPKELLKIGNPKVDLDPIDVEIDDLKRKAGTSKTLPSDLIIKAGLKAKKEGNEKMLNFLRTIKPLNENSMKKSNFETLIREIVKRITLELTNNKKDQLEEDGAAAPGGMTTTANVSPISTPYAFSKKDKEDESLNEMTTTDSGTPGYMVPGAFSRKGGSKAGVEGSNKLGYHLTNIGKEEMKIDADKLYESVIKELRNIFN